MLYVFGFFIFRHIHCHLPTIRLLSAIPITLQKTMMVIESLDHNNFPLQWKWRVEFHWEDNQLLEEEVIYSKETPPHLWLVKKEITNLTRDFSCSVSFFFFYQLQHPSFYMFHLPRFLFVFIWSLNSFFLHSCLICSSSPQSLVYFIPLHPHPFLQNQSLFSQCV